MKKPGANNNQQKTNLKNQAKGLSKATVQNAKASVEENFELEPESSKVNKKEKNVRSRKPRPKQSDDEENVQPEEDGDAEEQEASPVGSSSAYKILLGNQEFDSLRGKVSDNTLKAIAEMGFTKMTDIQAKAIPSLLEGRDLISSAKTGSGQTLAFLIPAVELQFKPQNACNKTK